MKNSAGSVLSCRAFGLAVLVLLLAPSLSWAQVYQRVPFASSPNPVGSGGRALAWGGAFIAVSDDATAASWNPGGLVQLVTPEASVALSYHTRQEQMSFSGYDAGSESRIVSTAQLNYASIVYPFNFRGYNMVASLNYQRLFDFDRDLEYSASGTHRDGYDFDETRTLEQKGALTTLTPALGIQITPAWSLGVAVNFWGLDPEGDGWEQQWQVSGSRQNPWVEVWSETRESYEVTGTNFVIGTHYKIQNFTIGAVYKSSWEADVKFKGVTEYANYFPLNPIANNHGKLKFEDDQKLVWPEAYGLGVAYRYSDNLSFALDAYTIRWSQFKLKTDEGDLNLLAGNNQTANVKDTWQVRAGFEYLWILPRYVVALRGGGLYDPEPLQDEINEFYGVTIGGGFVYDKFVVDAAFQYRWGNDLKGERIEGVEAKTDAQDYFAVVSLIYHF